MESEKLSGFVAQVNLLQLKRCVIISGVHCQGQVIFNVKITRPAS